MRAVTYTNGKSIANCNKPNITIYAVEVKKLQIKNGKKTSSTFCNGFVSKVS